MRKIFLSTAVTLFVMALIVTSCKKEIGNPSTGQQEEVATSSANQNSEHGHLKQTKEYSSDVVLKWMGMQLEMMRTSAPFIGGVQASRVFGYSGIALYESVVPGMPSYQTLSGQLTGMPLMPLTVPGYAYHWPAVANAALAIMSEGLIPTATVTSKTAMKSLEDSLNAIYKIETDVETFQRSVAFGQQVAQLILSWSKTDGASVNGTAPYTPLGIGYWAPTPPAFLPAFGAKWGENRLMVASSLVNSDLPAPPVYSTDPSSDYYKMVKEVYDISQTMTPAQRSLGLFFRDNPGFGGGHYLSIFKQILKKANPTLDFTAMAYAESGIAITDAGIGCWKTKYRYNQERPIKYIREVLGHSTWGPLFATPNFPDFPSGHSTLAGALAEVWTNLFGNNYSITDHSYDYLNDPNIPSQTFTSFDDLADKIGKSRVFAGIHYTNSCVAGTQQGRIIAKNILNNLKFLKE